MEGPVSMDSLYGALLGPGRCRTNTSACIQYTSCHPSQTGLHLCQSLTAQLHCHIGCRSIKEIIHNNHQVVRSACPQRIVSDPWQRLGVANRLRRQQTAIRRTGSQHTVHHGLGNIGCRGLALDVDEPAPATALRMQHLAEPRDDAVAIERCVACVCICRDRVDIGQQEQTLAVVPQVANGLVSQVL